MTAMRRPGLRVAAAVVAAGLVLLGLTVPAGADESITDKVQDAGEALDAADAEVSAALTKLADAKDRLPAARARLQTATEREAKAAEADRVAAARLQQATAELVRAEQEREAKEAQIAGLRADVGELARAVYQRGPYAELDVLLSSEDPGDFTAKLAVLQSVSRANTASLTRMAAARADLALDEARLDALRAEVQKRRQEVAARFAEARAAQDEAAAAKADLDALVQQRAEALQVARAKRDKVKERYDELRAEQARIAAQTSSSGGVYTGPAPSGSLSWPIPGAGTGGQVGPRIHPVYGYRSCHTGIDISGGMGTPIRSAANGVVTSVQNGGPYGLHMILSHGGGISTMYAHMSRTAVSGGAQVSAGQVIGYVGSTGYSTGPHLHFEVHVNGTPFNPLGWFGGPRGPILC